MIVLEAQVRGIVQGVGYRYFAARRAAALGLAGYARNLPNGSVEVAAEGGRPALETFLLDLNEGPLSSSVHSVEARWSESEKPRFSGFQIKF